MNKKGFTLVELIAVIAVLAIIITISVTMYGNTQNEILNQQYENTKKDILLKAEDYAHENNFTENKEITVQDLIDKGVILPEENGKLTNPKTHESLNCWTIKITYIKGEKVEGVTNPPAYQAQIVDENKKCS